MPAFEHPAPEKRQGVLALVRFVGFRRARILFRLVRQGLADRQTFSLYCAYAGVQGAPVQSAWERWAK